MKFISTLFPSQRLQTFSGLGAFAEARELLVTQHFTIGVGRFLLFVQLFETFRAADIGLRDPGEKFLIADINPLVIGVGLGPVLLFGLDFA